MRERSAGGQQGLVADRLWRVHRGALIAAQRGSTICTSYSSATVSRVFSRLLKFGAVHGHFFARESAQRVDRGVAGDLMLVEYAQRRPAAGIQPNMRHDVSYGYSACFTAIGVPSGTSQEDGSSPAAKCRNWTD